MNRLWRWSLASALLLAPGVAGAVDPPPECPDPLDFEYGADDTALPAGTVIDDEFNDLGIDIHCDNNVAKHPDACLIFDTANPTGGDADLGTPNEDFGGPGKGKGGEEGSPGENAEALGNILIIAEHDHDPDEDGIVNDPDDEASGGAIHIDFDDPMTVESVGIVDIEEDEMGGTVTAYTGDGMYVFDIAALGNNSVQTVGVGVSDVMSITIELVGSGGVSSISYCPDDDDDGLLVPPGQGDPHQPSDGDADLSEPDELTANGATGCTIADPAAPLPVDWSALLLVAAGLGLTRRRR